MGLYIPACHAFGWDPPNAIFLGRKDQIEKYAVPTMAAGAKTFVAISEPSGGSDPGRAIQTRAEKKGDRYILNGTKVWISGTGQSDWGLVFARTGEQGPRRRHILHRREEVQGLFLQADPGDPLVLPL